MRPNSPMPFLSVTRTGSILLAGLLCVASCGAPEPEEAPVKPSVRVYEVGVKATGQIRRITGRIEALDQSALSFGVGGRVDEIIVEEGTRPASRSRCTD